MRALTTVACALSSEPLLFCPVLPLAHFDHYGLVFCHDSPNLSSLSFSHPLHDHAGLSRDVSFSLLECELSEAGPDAVLVTLLLQCHLAHKHAQKSKVNVELASLPLPFSVAKSLFMSLNM